MTPQNLFPSKTVRFTFANVSANDARFLAGLAALFCDPQKRQLLAHVRAGRYGLQYQPGTGELHWMDLHADLAATPGDLIEFVARFSDEEWNACDRAIEFRAAVSARDLEEASEIAGRVLGYLPAAVRMEAVSG